MIQDKPSRTLALSTLADKIPPELLPEALSAAKTIQSDWKISRHYFQLSLH
ncbi:hypothetical protein [Brasilonema sp. UFV-L1]|uniref:hypothetical protein n=1 Tax=Brasilonema sp. UFV-L1 TaxID=2234130 RepID=UPI00145C4ED2|nr:hypothetical protein [Brasilonema sp. UFV-L1]